MNGKIAKRLRKSTAGKENVEYTHTYTKNTKIYKEEDGTLKHFGYTAKLKNDTHRYNYKKAKKDYKN